MIYLDHNATTAMLPEVQQAVARWQGVAANPSSVHRLGQRAASAVEQAQRAVAALVGADPEDVCFTSGATEANHTIVRGWGQGGVALSAGEHPSVHAAAGVLEAQGVAVQRLPLDAEGRVRLQALAPTISLLSVQAANHETGVCQPFGQALGRARQLGARLHVDATQAAGRVPLDLGDVDAVVLSAHKLGGPCGVGAMIARAPYPSPLLPGGSQQRGRRAGTVNVAGAVGFGVACELARAEISRRGQRWQQQSERLRAGLRALGARELGAGAVRLPNTSCVVFPGVPGEAMVQALDLRGICVSSGAACASGSVDPSPVLIAMGDPEPAGALRISLGPDSQADDLDALLRALGDLLPLLRGA